MLKAENDPVRVAKADPPRSLFRTLPDVSEIVQDPPGDRLSRIDRRRNDPVQMRPHDEVVRPMMHLAPGLVAEPVPPRFQQALRGRVPVGNVPVKKDRVPHPQKEVLPRKVREPAGEGGETLDQSRMGVVVAEEEVKPALGSRLGEFVEPRFRRGDRSVERLKGRPLEIKDVPPRGRNAATSGRRYAGCREAEGALDRRESRWRSETKLTCCRSFLAVLIRCGLLGSPQC